MSNNKQLFWIKISVVTVSIVVFGCGTKVFAGNWLGEAEYNSGTGYWYWNWLENCDPSAYKSIIVDTTNVGGSYAEANGPGGGVDYSCGDGPGAGFVLFSASGLIPGTFYVELIDWDSRVVGYRIDGYVTVGGDVIISKISYGGTRIISTLPVSGTIVATTTSQQIF